MVKEILKAMNSFRYGQGNPKSNELIHPPSQPLHEGLSHIGVTDVYETQNFSNKGLHNDCVSTSDGQQYTLKVYKEKDIFLPCPIWIWGFSRNKGLWK